MGAVLSGVSVPSYLGPRPAAHKGILQLAEAIHTTPDPDFGEPDIDDNQSILLTDTSTHRQLQQNDELFAVEEDPEEDEEDEAVVTSDRAEQEESDQEDSNQEDSDDGHDDGAQPDSDRLGLMGNSHARRSWVDLSDLGENVVQNGTDMPGGGNLGAKAGIILVRFPAKAIFFTQATNSRNFFPPAACPHIMPLGHTQHLRRHSAVPRDWLDRADIRPPGATKVRAPWKSPWQSTA